jgi:hypothetical protein
MSGRTVVEFHATLAEMLISAKRQHDGREAAGLTAAERAGTVDMWRRFAHLAGIYANGAAVRGIRPNWKAFWEDGIDRAGMLRLIARRGRFTRLHETENAAEVLSDDTLDDWECRLAGELVFTLSLVESPLSRTDAFTSRRVATEHDVTLSVARAYTGLDLATLRRAVREADGVKPVYGYGNLPDGGYGRQYRPHALMELITANRPTV